MVSALAMATLCLTAGDGLRLIGTDVLGAVGTDNDGLVGADDAAVVAANGNGLIVEDALGAVIADLNGLVMGNVGVAVAADLEVLVVDDERSAVMADTENRVLVHRFSPIPVNPDGFILIHGCGPRPVDGEGLLLIDCLGPLAVDRDPLVVVDRLGAIMLDVAGLVVADGLGTVLPDLDGLVVGDIPTAIIQYVLTQVVLDGAVFVELTMLTEELIAFGVVHDVFVVTTAALGAVGHESADGGATGEAIGWLIDAVVDPAGDDGPVGIAFQEVDDDFLANAGDCYSAPALAGPRVGDAYPAGAVLVGFTVAVPVELDLDLPVLVGPDLFAGFADDDGGLGTPGSGHWGFCVGGGRGFWHPGR